MRATSYRAIVIRPETAPPPECDVCGKIVEEHPNPSCSAWHPQALKPLQFITAHIEIARNWARQNVQPGVTVQIWEQSARVGEGIGSCSTWETKYRYRFSSRRCPACGAEAIIKGKEDYGGGWLCYAKKGGCGAKFSDNDPAITEQALGKVPNPDIADVINTVQKQGEKRAYVEATLSATGASAFFSQDEDVVEAPEEPARSAGKPAASKPNAAATAEPATDARKVPDELKLVFERAHEPGGLQRLFSHLEDEMIVAGKDAGRQKYKEMTAALPADKKRSISALKSFALDLYYGPLAVFRAEAEQREAATRPEISDADLPPILRGQA